ncbi:hypothetical protein AAZX31_15G046300 [Glycine max]|uniref:Uncharacterized protein n=1 Tax=Glycine max TaxID=3847 RepID=A0A0R0G3B8_SOYBN|nr:hypothetical protein JHK86_041462 [Glycine max]KAG4955690.1 hypothetical protein JHK85_042070 [Glycine max]KAG5104435.1 hypothetical protein JHK82_041405 [Glycine max]KAG5115558.1 hypothetical protein JHK84_041671 [Glycine max]KAH1145609.1 hypothetical protein GYH30_041363 [Glycine max]
MNFRRSLPLSHRGLRRRVRTEARPQNHHLQRREQNDPPSAAALEAIRGLRGARKDAARVHCKGRFAPRLSGAGVGGVDLRRGARFQDRFRGTSTKVDLTARRCKWRQISFKRVLGAVTVVALKEEGGKKVEAMRKMKDVQNYIPKAISKEVIVRLQRE